MAILTEAEKKNIASAITAVELRTAGELVVMVTRTSSDYAAPRAALAACLSVAVAIEATHLLEGIPLWGLMLAQLPLGLFFFRLLGVSKLLRWVVPSAVRKASVERRAMRAFLEAGVAETRDRSGVLIYLSEVEQRAVILGDTGIHRRVPKGEWQTDVDALVAAIADGRPGLGLLAAIERIGGILAEAFPPRPDDQNELSDTVREV